MLRDVELAPAASAVTLDPPKHSWIPHGSGYSSLAALKGLAASIGCRDLAARRPESDAGKRALLWRERRFFGITRIGSVTGLDRIGIPVVQAVRPNAQSNVVSQGKGATFEQAFISATMEALETWAAERIPPWRKITEFQRHDRNLFGRSAPAHLLTPRIEGLDLLTGAIEAVPACFVETRYVSCARQQVPFDQTTTGLAAGFDLSAALCHALSETLERYSVAVAERDLLRIDPQAVPFASSQRLICRIRAANIYISLEAARLRHGVPVWRCCIADGDPAASPRLPAIGFGCRTVEEDALNAALLEAVQARLAALVGSREDITRDQYPPRITHRHVEDMLRHLQDGEAHFIPFQPQREFSTDAMTTYLEALTALGAEAVYAVPVYHDLNSGLSVVRVVAPPLFGR